MKNKDVILLYQKLETMTIKGTKTAYATARNKRKLSPIVDSIKDSAVVLEGDDKTKFEEMETERQILLKEHGRKNPDGSLVIIGQEVSLIDNALYFKAYNLLREKFKDVLELDAKNQKINAELLEEEAEEVEFYKIKFDDLPDDLNQEQMDTIIVFVDEN